MTQHEKSWVAAATRKENVFLVKSNIGTRKAWYYLDVILLRLPLFQRRIGNESLRLTEYGQILFSGWGENPPENIRMQVES